MFDLLTSIDEGKEIKKELSSNKDKYIVINNNSYPKEEVDYYYKKSLFLMQNRYFEKEKIKWGLIIDRKSIIFDMFTHPNIVFETTTKCNLKCEYCGFGDYYDNYGDRKTDYINFDIAKKIIDYNLKLCIKHSGAPIIKFNIGFYGGEPLMNFPFMEKVVQYVKTLETDRIKFTFNMTTNGILLSKHQKFLHDNNFILSISLDGNEFANQYRKLHNGKPSFKIVYKNIKQLQKTYPDYFESNIRISAVHHNKNSLGGVLDFCNKEFSKTPILSQLSDIGIAENKQAAFKEKFFKDPLKKTNRFKCLENEYFELRHLDPLSLFHHNLNKYKYNTYASLLLPRDANRKFRPTSTCNPFNRKMFVTTKGDIYACEKIGRQYLLGNVNKEKVNIDFKGIKEMYKRIFEKAVKLCESCLRITNCSSCVFEIIDYNDEITYCEYYVDNSNQHQYLLSYIEKMEEDPDNYSNSITKYKFS